MRGAAEWMRLRVGCREWGCQVLGAGWERIGARLEAGSL